MHIDAQRQNAAGCVTAELQGVAALVSDEGAALLVEGGKVVGGEAHLQDAGLARSKKSGLGEGLEFLGVKIDKELNKGLRGVEKVISTADSKVTVCIIPTDEELMIATDTMELVSK